MKRASAKDDGNNKLTLERAAEGLDGVERRGKTDVDAVHGCNGLKREAEERHRQPLPPTMTSISFFLSLSTLLLLSQLL